MQPFEIDAQLRAWALAAGGAERHYPALIAAGTLARAGYPEAFPQLLMAPAAARDPAQPFTVGNATLADAFLSPAVCYHAYAALEGRVVEREAITACGHCFRNETLESLAPGRRQIEFQMRELILVGQPAWVEDRLTHCQPEVEALAVAAGLTVAWQPACDPFFLPSARVKAHAQRLLGTKIELCLPDGLAVASINRHGPFFGERFNIRLADHSPAHSACVAFGLDRWAAHIRTFSP